ncbi:MAG TPA: hypothetical protein VLU25_02640 [Acidobacteriota bacterium]|nr:hypothetical protein [Acidobacteriota bacterium]
MARVLKSGLWIVLFMLVAAPALAQDSKTLAFSIKPDAEKRALFGTVARQDGLWKVHSIGLTVHSVM